MWRLGGRAGGGALWRGTATARYRERLPSVGPSAPRPRARGRRQAWRPGRGRRRTQTLIGPARGGGRLRGGQSASRTPSPRPATRVRLATAGGRSGGGGGPRSVPDPRQSAARKPRRPSLTRPSRGTGAAGLPPPPFHRGGRPVPPVKLPAQVKHPRVETGRVVVRRGGLARRPPPQAAGGRPPRQPHPRQPDGGHHLRRRQHQPRRSRTSTSPPTPPFPTLARPYPPQPCSSLMRPYLHSVLRTCARSATRRAYVLRSTRVRRKARR